MAKTCKSAEAATLVATAALLLVLLGEQDVLAVVGQEHPLGSDEQHAVGPIGDGTLAPRPGLLLALVPVQGDRRQVAPLPVQPGQPGSQRCRGWRSC